MALQSARLKRLRQAVGVSQAAAAKAAGVSKDAWNRMESGKHQLSTLALARFADAFAVHVEYAITGRLAGLSEAVLRAVVAAEHQPAPDRSGTTKTGKAS